MCLEMQRALVTGTPLMGCEKFEIPERARVLFVEQELGDMMLHPRATKIFAEEAREGRLAELNDWLFYASKSNLDLSSPEGRKMLGEWIDDARPNVVFLDPIGKLHSYAENDAGDINKLFHTLQEFLFKYQDLGMSFVMSHHFGKLNPDPRAARDELDPLNFRGSMRWVGDPDTIVTVKRVKEYETYYEDGRTSSSGEPYYDWWDVKMKFTMRGGAEPKNCWCSINEFDDFRVRFKKFEETKTREKPKPIPRLGIRSGTLT